MTDQGSPALPRFAAEKVVQLQTRRRDGSWVDTPVNFAVQGDRAYFRTRDGRPRTSGYAIFPTSGSARARGPASRRVRRRRPRRDCCPVRRRGPRAPDRREVSVVQRIGVHLAHRLARTSTLHYELSGVTDMPG